MAATAIVKRPVLELITASKSNFEVRLPAGMTAERFMYGLATACQKNAALMSCEPQSVVLAAYEAAEVGCNLSPSLALGWLIPYGKDAQFQPSYRFFLQKAYESGLVTAFYAEVVYENDIFSREFAPKRTLTHMPPPNDERGPAIGAYALIEFKDGHIDWEYMTASQIERHRSASKNPNSLMWKTFWEEGWKKTPLRVLAKRLPMTNPGMEKLAEIVNRDAERDSDPVIPGRLDIEEVHAEPVATQHIESQAVERSGGDAVRYHIGNLLTEISGLKLRRQFTTEEMKPLGLKIDKDGRWTIPAVQTPEFLDLCGTKRVTSIEIDGNGEERGRTEITDDDLPESMFEDLPK